VGFRHYLDLSRPLLALNSTNIGFINYLIPYLSNTGVRTVDEFEMGILLKMKSAAAEVNSLWPLF